MHDQKSPEVTPQIVAPPPEPFSPAGGIFFEVTHVERQATVLEETRVVLGDPTYDLMDWRVATYGLVAIVTGVLRQRVTVATVDSVVDTLNRHPEVAQPGSPTPITLAPTEAPPQAGEVAAAAGYDSDWFWPVGLRLPKSDYDGAPEIRIAHMDTGVSKHPNLTGGVDGAASMDFFLPPDRRQGRGVICWNADHPYFISHGTGTGGLMVGTPESALSLHGMTPRGVVVDVPCRVADIVVLFPDDVDRLTEAIHWAIGEGIKVINVSLANIAFDPDPRLRDAVRAAHDHGVIMCCAAGQIAAGMVWPAAFSLRGWCICCGPSTQERMPSPMSAWFLFPEGYVTIAAPGVYMPRAYWADDNCARHVPELISSEGTSYSAAFVSSVAALWWARNWPVLSQMPPHNIVPLFRSVIQKTCFPWRRWPGFGNFGPGILDPNGVLNAPI
jgi:subtilisin family serine protease